MEETLFHGCVILLAFLLALKLLLPKQRYKNLPPSHLTALPIIGHLHLLQHPVHRMFQDLSRKCGSIFSLKFGNRLVVVVSSSSAAEECFSKNDVVLANRPRFLINKHIGYNSTTIAGSSYGDHWRNLRRLAAEDIFSTARLKIFQSFRQDETKRLLQSLYSSLRCGSARVELKSKLSELSFNVITRMVAGKRYFGDSEDDEDAKKFRGLINEVFEQSDASNPDDFLPFLRWIDYGGREKGLARIAVKMDAFFQSLIDEHRRDKRNTMIGHLLSLQESDPQYYTDQIIKGLIMNMLTAGTDTSSTTIEWAMSLLLNHPEVLKKARSELDLHVDCRRLVEETDLSKLDYLQCIISETFRLFPASPLLAPHETSDDCLVQGYDIPRGTIVLFNVWAIHRDPEIWEDPTSFKPERFEGKEINPYVLMPFGRGRRTCPGAGLAQRVVGLVLASLIHCFEWERTTKEEVKLVEGKGFAMPKVEPLEAMCRARDFTHKILST